MTRKVCLVVAVAAVWIITARLSVSIEVEPRFPQLWIPSGVALGAVLVLGRSAALGVALGAWTFVLARGRPVPIALSIAAVAAAEALAGAYLLDHVLRFRASLERLRDVLALLLGATVVALPAASVTAAMKVGLGHGFSSALVATRWWSHVSAAMIITPLITGLAHAHRRDIGGSAIAAIVNLFITGIAIATWFAGIGPFTRFGQVQVFSSITSVTTLALAALAGERNRAVVRKVAIQDAALDAIVSVDAHGMIVEYNPAAEALFGVLARSAIGCNAIDLLLPEADRARVLHELVRFGSEPAEQWRDRRIRHILLRATGGEFPAEIAITRVQVRDELLFTGFVRDISIEANAEAERRQSRESLELQVYERTADLIHANEELKRRDALVHQAQSLAHLGSFEYDLASRRLQWSDELARILGRDPETFSATAERLLACVHPDDRVRVRSAIVHAVTCERSFACQLRVIKADGVIAFVECEGRVERAEDGGPPRIIGYCQDVTERERTEQKIRQSLREKEVLLREIHHRVKNNLQVISSLLNLQVERVPSADARHALAESQSRIQSMALVHQLLYRSKDFSHIDFLEYLQTVVDSLVRSYMTDKTPIETAVLGTRIQLDVDRAITCGLIVTELVTNALRHAFAGRRSGHLDIELAARAGDITLSVRDDGTGIPESAKLGTTTFGLQIARTLTQQLAGSIDIARDAGTVIQIRFPLGQQAAAA